MKKFLTRTAVITALTVGGLVGGIALPATSGTVVAGGDRNWCC